MEINLDDKFCEKLLDCLTSISSSLKSISHTQKVECERHMRECAQYNTYMNDVMKNATFVGGEMPSNDGSPVFPK